MLSLMTPHATLRHNPLAVGLQGGCQVQEKPEGLAKKRSRLGLLPSCRRLARATQTL